MVRDKADENIRLETERLFLSPLCETEVEEFFDYRSDAVANRFQGWIPSSVEEARSFIRERISSVINQSGTWFQLGIHEKMSGMLIGDIGIYFMENDQVMLGCTVTKKHQGKGYASEALSCTIAYLCHDFGKTRFFAIIDSANEASRKLFEKLKFRQDDEAILGDSEWDQNNDLIYSFICNKPC